MSQLPIAILENEESLYKGTLNESGYCFGLHIS